MNTVIIAALCTVGVGLFVGIFLGAAGIIFKVKTDEREEKVLAALPGNNCGGCGYPGCSGLAAAIVKGKAPVNGCPVGGNESASKIAEIMGTEGASSERQVAFVACQGKCDKTVSNYEYTGPVDCRMMGFAPGGGPKACREGCLGGGTCVSVCPFDAIHIVDGVALVDKEKCKACGKCIQACPRKLIRLVPYNEGYVVACSSHDRGPDVIKACSAGCIGCGICARNCPAGAATVTDNLASIDRDKCASCGVCAEKCPKKVIIKK